MYLAGTIIFGGGPVVIPLLRSYVVDPGWVCSRDFLLGLAIIQAFPGPNFKLLKLYTHIDISYNFI
jgi:chromate transport protein ChrA